MIADMEYTSKLSPIVTELFLRGRKLNILLVCISQSYFKMSKTIRLNKCNIILLWKLLTKENFNKQHLVIYLTFYNEKVPFLYLPDAALSFQNNPWVTNSKIKLLFFTFELLTWTWRIKVTLWVSNLKWKYTKICFKSLTRYLNFFCFTFELLTWSWKTKSYTSSY